VREKQEAEESQHQAGGKVMRIRSLIPACLVFLVVLGIAATSAQAETTGPVWKVLSVDTPTNFKPEDKTGDDAIVVTAVNIGGSAAGCTQAQITLEKKEEEEYLLDPKHEKGRAPQTVGCPPKSPVTSPITIADVLPKGLTAVEVFGVNAYHDPVGQLSPPGEQTSGSPFGLSCTLSPTAPSCTTSERIDPGDTLVITIRVDVETAVAGESEVNEASVSGGGAASASVSEPVTIGTASPAYGVAKGGLFGATSTSQAGGHPNVTNEFFLNTINPEGEKSAKEGSTALSNLLESEPPGLPKDVRFDLPPGLVGTTVGIPRCTMAEVTNAANCPQNTMVGTSTLIVQSSLGRLVITVPVFNIAPSPGEPAAFAFNALYFEVRLDTSVLSDGEYNVRVTAPNLTAGAKTYMSSVTFWGDPAEHNGNGPDFGARTAGGNRFLTEGDKPEVSFGGAGVEEEQEGDTNYKIVQEQRVPLLTNPSQCSTPLTGVLETDSWEAIGVFPGGPEYEAPMGTATGCGQLSFKPSVSMLPDTLEAGAPAGYAFALSLPQNTEAEGLATPDVKRTSVTLPLGTVISPSAADGLGVCSSAEFNLHSGVPGNCPRDSQVGEVSSKTPALEERLTGEIYLASPQCTGASGVCTPQDATDGHMIRLFLQLVGEGESGIVVKQELTGQINQQTGQLTVVDDEVPEVPFSDLKLTLQGGERATLANPRTCGTVTTTADLTPWSSPFTPDGTPTSSFNVGGCPAPQFNPSFSGGTTSNQAGGFSPFTLSFGRSDADQFLNGAQITMPPGLLGLISKVKLCEEPQANAGTCGPESQIGEVTVETGPGADPFLVTGGKVYITGPYKGAPYGLSIVVPAKAGPYTLAGTTGNGTVVNRSSIAVNPETAALTVTSDPLPTELDGIPLQLRLVNVTVGTNNDFTFNPTDCNKLEVGGGLTSTEAAKASRSSSFQVTNCAALKFKPSFTAISNAHTSKKDGASLLFKIAYPKGSQGTESWLKAMKFDIPKQLPARLTTLQKSCLVATFEANPAACPAASVIGKAIVHTPVLPAPLEGPVYFVSHGGAKFPEVVVVLQADNVSLELHGETFISKTGVTSATFRTVPDAPFETAEVFVPTGPNSEFAAIGDICTETLTMPNSFTPQSGTEIKQSTKIAVTGCPKPKKVKKKAKKASKARKSSNNGRAQS
jgi:hypothetical protein